MYKKAMSLGKRPMGWEEVLFETGAAEGFSDVIVDTWSESNKWAEVASTGHYAVASDPSSLYLDGGVTSGGITSRGKSHPGVWVDLTADVMNASNHQYLLGGEASMWTDAYLPGKKCNGCCLHSPARDVDFAKAISATIWPRAAVAAGTFWRWDERLDPKGTLFSSVLASATNILAARGVQTCPCSNATYNGCNQGHFCGVPFCNTTSL
jgi:hypothetical protein